MINKKCVWILEYFKSLMKVYKLQIHVILMLYLILYNNIYDYSKVTNMKGVAAFNL